MISKKIVEGFCADINNYTNPKTLKPFNYHGYTYATDGKVGIKVRLMTEYKHNESIEMDRIWPDLDKFKIEFKPLPNIVESILEYDFNCHEIHIKLNEIWFSLILLRKFSVFNNIRIHVPKNCDHDRRPALLVFDEGEGVLMPVIPLRKRT